MVSRTLTTGLIVVVVGAGLVTGVLYYPAVMQFLGLNKTTTPTQPQSFFSNSTVISLKNQTTQPPLIQPATTLMGGNQYAALHFAMHVVNNGSYQFSNMHWIGSVYNFTGSSLADIHNIPISNTTQPNFNTTFNIVPSITNATFANYTNQNGNIIPLEFSSLTAGDIAGQGKDMLIASYSITIQNKTDSKLVVLDWNNNTQTFTPWTNNITLGLYYPTVLALNLRGYDAEQLIVAGFSSLNTSYVTLKMINFSPTGNLVTNGSQVHITTTVLNNIQVRPGPLVLEKGDLYGYGAQQFLIYGVTQEGLHYASLYDYNLTTNAVFYLSTIQDGNLGRPLLTSFFTNGIDQLVAPCFTTCSPDISNPTYTSFEAGFIYIFDPLNNSLLKYALFPYSGALGAGTIDGANANELILLQTNSMSLFRYNSNYMLYNYTTKKFNALPIDVYQQTPRTYPLSTGTTLYMSDYMPVLVTDLTFDSIPEMITPDYLTGGARFFLMRKDQLVTPSNNLIDSQYAAQGTLLQYESSNFTYYDMSNARTVGDLFGQALRLIHQDTYLTLSNPTIMAVLAAPPTVSAIGQDPTNALTSYGTSTSQASSVESSTSLGFDLEMGLGVKTEISYGVGVEALGLEMSFMGKVGFGMTFSHSYEKTHTVQLSQSWGTDGQHNGVVFASLLVKHWNYTVVNGPLNGDNLTFSYPQAVTIQKFDASTFNKLYPSYNIIDSTFGNIQKIGHPETYPAKSQIATITKGSPFVYESAEKGVSQGTGYDTVQIDSSTESSSSYGFDFHTSAGFSFEMATEGFQMSLDYSFNSAHGQTFTNTQGIGTTYYGQITDINSYSNWQHYQYNYGLFAYLLNRPNLNISYQVINYWTNPLGPSFGNAGAALAFNLLPSNVFHSNLMALVTGLRI